MSKDKETIVITENGPYAVPDGIRCNNASLVCDEGGVSESWQVRGDYDTGSEETYYLCRCGHSRKKPFCDASHEKTGFRGREKPERFGYEDRAERYRGPGLDLLDDKSLCVVARFCDKGDSIWNMVARSDDPTVRETVIREACDCPGGRLTAVARDGRRIEPDLPREISLVNDPSRNMRGPLWVKGGIPVRDAAGRQYEERNRVALCRCGESRNMPFCDATHYQCPHMEGQDE